MPPVLVLFALPGALVFSLILVGLGLLRELPVGLVVSVAAAGLLLPVALGRAALPDKELGSSLGLLLGPWLGLLLIPAYFPGERGDALSAGAVVLLSPVGLDASRFPAHALDSVLPAPVSGRALPGLAPPVIGPAPPPRLALPLPDEVTALDQTRSDLPDEAVVLPYEGSGRSLSVPVTLVSGEAEQDVWMLFDTGATITTVDRATLRQLGVRVPDDAPSLTVRTANGERDSEVVLLDGVWIGGFLVEGVSVSVCEECADSRTTGLLGLNVSGGFLVTVDQAREELVLQPRSSAPDRTVDISPWLDIEAQASRWPDGRVEVEITVFNNAERDIEAAEVHIDCGERFVASFAGIPAARGVESVVSLPRDAECETYTVSLGAARW